MKLIINTDGGARGNPGPAATGYIIKDEAKNIIAEGGTYLGEATNNVAEYQAVIDALEWLQAAQNLPTPHELHFYLDSNLVVQQLLGNFKIKNAPLLQMVQTIQKNLSANQWKAFFYHVPRAENQDADRMVNQILDANS